MQTPGTHSLCCCRGGAGLFGRGREGKLQGFMSLGVCAKHRAPRYAVNSFDFGPDFSFGLFLF
jgi:hypothetical protein